MSAKLDRVAEKVGAPKGLHLRRTRAGHWQRAQGAWSWYAVDDEGREVLASHYPLTELLTRPGLTARHALDNPLAALEVDPAYCEMCRRREAVRDYDPFIAEIYPEDDARRLLCEECWQTRKDDV